MSNAIQAIADMSQRMTNLMNWLAQQEAKAQQELMKALPKGPAPQTNPSSSQPTGSQPPTSTSSPPSGSQPQAQAAPSTGSSTDKVTVSPFAKATSSPSTSSPAPTSNTSSNSPPIDMDKMRKDASDALQGLQNMIQDNTKFFQNQATKANDATQKTMEDINRPPPFPGTDDPGTGDATGGPSPGAPAPPPPAPGGP